MSTPVSSWERACAEVDLAPSRPHKVNIAGRDIALVRTGEGVFAVDDICSHAQWSLSDGDVEDCTIECSLHGARFDLRTGQPSGLPAVVPVATYAVKIEDGSVFIGLSN
ncbi:MAG: hypothetical protein RL745_934 [Actinomycetota bacterium]